MSIQELAEKIGTRGLIHMTPDVQVAVEIINVKVSYGRPRYMVRPLQGLGATWVEAFRLTPLETATEVQRG